MSYMVQTDVRQQRWNTGSRSVAPPPPKISGVRQQAPRVDCDAAVSVKKRAEQDHKAPVNASEWDL